MCYFLYDFLILGFMMVTVTTFHFFSTCCTSLAFSRMPWTSSCWEYFVDDSNFNTVLIEIQRCGSDVWYRRYSESSPLVIASKSISSVKFSRSHIVASGVVKAINRPISCFIPKPDDYSEDISHDLYTSARIHSTVHHNSSPTFAVLQTDVE